MKEIFQEALKYPLNAICTLLFKKKRIQENCRENKMNEKYE